MKRLVFFVFAFVLAGWGSALAQPHPDSAASRARIAAQNDFRQQSNGAAWTIRRHEITEVPVSIFDGPGPSRAPALKGATPGAKAQGFFARHRQMFGYRPAADEFEVESVKERRDFIYVQLKQNYEGVPVHRGGYKVKMTRTGELRMISGRFFPDIDVDVTPGLSASRAGEIATEAIPADSLVRKPDADLVVYPGEGRYALAYEVRLAGDPPPQSWRVFVDAQTGNVLEKENVTRYLASATARPSLSTPVSSRSGSPVPTTGSGKVYLDDPNDGSTSIEDLPRLSGNGSSLTGTYAEAHNYGGTNASPTSSPATYHFSPSNVHFDEVNLYYHVDRYADHLPSIGFPGLGRTIEAYAHFGNDYNNAFYDEPNDLGNGKQLYFGDGDGIIFQDFAKDNDVIYHEYNHAVLDNLDIGYNTDETGSLQEGTADYLAASFDGEPRIGEWVTVCSSTGDLRTVSNSENTFHYSNRSNVEYAYCSKLNGGAGGHLNAEGGHYAVGMIWSGALWDLRNTLGASTTDELVIEAFNSLSNTPDFHQARDALVQADNDFNGGSNTCDIKGTLANRGIGDIYTYISGPGSLDGGEEGTWDANAGCSGGGLSYQWYEKYPADDSFSPISGATSSSYTASYYGDVTLKVEVTTNGYTSSGTKSVSVDCNVICVKSRLAGLSGFDGQLTGAGVATLTWRATTAPDGGFEVQRTEGTGGGWTTVGTAAAHAKDEADTYRFIDRDLPYAADTLRYRLRLAGTEGTASISDPITVVRKEVASVTLQETYPNPAAEQVTVRYAVPEEVNGPARLALYDVMGRKVRSVRATPERGRQITRFDVGGLASGVYVLRLRAGGTSKTRRLTVVQ